MANLHPFRNNNTLLVKTLSSNIKKNYCTSINELNVTNVVKLGAVGTTKTQSVVNGAFSVKQKVNIFF